MIIKFTGGKKIQTALKHTQMYSSSTLRDTIFHLPYWQKSKNLTTHSVNKALELQVLTYLGYWEGKIVQSLGREI